MPELTTHLFTIGVAGRPRTAILVCAGPMDPPGDERLRGALAAAAGTGVPVVEVDLRKASRLTAGAAAALLQAHAELAAQGRELRLVVDPRTHARLSRLGIGAILSLRPAGETDLARRPGNARDDEGVRWGCEAAPEREEP